MLQQTQVERVTEKYREFLATFPDLPALAAAPLQEVLARWQGLGYNRRAVNLKQCAEAVVARWDGALPSSPEELQTLPGIGRTPRGPWLPLPSMRRRSSSRPTSGPSLSTYSSPPRRRSTTGSSFPSWLSRLTGKTPGVVFGSHGLWYRPQAGAPDPSRRSAHHVRQSPFRGSNREVRGMLVKVLLEQPGKTRTELVACIGRDADVVGKNLEQLRKEGFIVSRGDATSSRDPQPGRNASQEADSLSR